MIGSIHTHRHRPEIGYCHGDADIFLMPHTTGYGTFHQGRELPVYSGYAPELLGN